MTIGWAGDSAPITLTPSPPAGATAEQTSGSQIGMSVGGLVSWSGQIDRVHEDVTGRPLSADTDPLMLILQQLQIMTLHLSEGLNTTIDIDPQSGTNDPGLVTLLN